MSNSTEYIERKSAVRELGYLKTILSIIGITLIVGMVSYLKLSHESYYSNLEICRAEFYNHMLFGVSVMQLSGGNLEQEIEMLREIREVTNGISCPHYGDPDAGRLLLEALDYAISGFSAIVEEEPEEILNRYFRECTVYVNRYTELIRE